MEFRKYLGKKTHKQMCIFGRNAKIRFEGAYERKFILKIEITISRGVRE